MKKMTLLIIALLLSTGCSVNYNINVDKNFKITEQISVEEKNDYFEIQYDNPKDGMKSVFNNVNNSLKYKIDNYNISEGVNTVKFNVKNKYENESSYSNSNILKNLNGKVEVYNNPDLKKNTSVFQVIINYDFFDILNTNKYSSIDVDDIKVNINFPYKIISSNADSTSKDGTLTWNINNNLKSRSFYIEYDETKTKSNNLIIVFIITTIVLILSGLLFIILFAKRKKYDNI